jgi:hypothetical protein
MADNQDVNSQGYETVANFREDSDENSKWLCIL